MGKFTLVHLEQTRYICPAFYIKHKKIMQKLCSCDKICRKYLPLFQKCSSVQQIQYWAICTSDLIKMCSKARHNMQFFFKTLRYSLDDLSKDGRRLESSVKLLGGSDMSICGAEAGKTNVLMKRFNLWNPMPLANVIDNSPVGAYLSK